MHEFKQLLSAASFVLSVSVIACIFINTAQINSDLQRREEASLAAWGEVRSKHHDYQLTSSVVQLWQRLLAAKRVIAAQERLLQAQDDLIGKLQERGTTGL